CGRTSATSPPSTMPSPPSTDRATQREDDHPRSSVRTSERAAGSAPLLDQGQSPGEARPPRAPPGRVLTRRRPPGNESAAANPLTLISQVSAQTDQVERPATVNFDSLGS